MIIGWDSKTDRFFISDLTELEAEALQGTIASLVEGINAGGISVGPSRLTNPQYLAFLNNLQDGLLKGHKTRQKIRGS